MLGFPEKVKVVLSKVPWYHHVLSFRDYGSLLIHLRDLQRLEDEKNQSGISGSLHEFLAGRMTAAMDAATHSSKVDFLSPIKPTSNSSSASAGGTGMVSPPPAAAAAAEAVAVPAPAPAATPASSSNPQGFVAGAAVVGLSSPTAAHTTTLADSAADEWK